ncbi:MAG: hypothetical protein HYV09_01750 [Deltaproteobacteria bacterium]|nr:hypothetical protein [Deltaproteobacteria bacterium]
MNPNASPLLRLAALVACGVLTACGGSTESPATPPTDAAAETAADTSTIDAPTCDATTCSAPGSVCRAGACVADCRFAGAVACGSGDACDFTDGKCKPPSAACFLPAVFEPCGDAKSCGPGLMCDGKGSCVLAGMACTGDACDATGRCWATGCPCERPAPRCTTATLDQLNTATFVGSPVNGRDQEGAVDLDFDDVCTAYAVTMISGPDYLRQLAPDGTLTSWTSTTNLNMGQVAVLRVPNGEFKELGDVAATYICCASCGCVETGEDGRLGVVHLDRASTTRPLPNVLPAKATSGSGPFGSPTLDAGPYALTWGADNALYAGNIETNGDFVRVDLAAKTTKNVTTFLARVTAAAIYDLARLLVATEGGKVYLLTTATGDRKEWAALPGHVTSLRRDKFTGRVYAEVATKPPQILEIAADGTGAKLFQTPPRLGRITIAPDNHLYHLSVFPEVFWKAKTSIVRWPLPATR